MGVCQKSEIFPAGGGLIADNLISNSTATYNDGGGIYFDYARLDNGALTIRNNILLKSLGNLQGTDPANPYDYTALGVGGLFRTGANQ